MRHVVSLLVLSSLLTPGADVLALPWAPQKQAAGSSSFTTLDQCMRELGARLPRAAGPMVFGDGLEATCRAREALSKGTKAPCRLLRDYRARERCELVYALQTGRVADCPAHGYPKVSQGLCAALVRRDPSLCRLAEDAAQPSCRGALLGRSACDQLKADDKARCLAAAAAYQGRLKATTKPLLPRGYRPTLAVSTTSPSGLVLPASVARFSSTRLSRGVLLADQPGAGDTFAISYNLAPYARYGSDRDPLKIKLWVALPASGTPTSIALGSGAGGGEVSFSVTSPYRHVQLPISGGRVTFRRFERKLGGRLIATFEATATNGVDSVRVEGRFDTFVRELIPLSSLKSAVSYLVRSPVRRYGYQRGRLTPREIADVKKSVRARGEDHYDIDTQLRDALFKDTGLITTGASIYPQRGEPGGYKLYRVYRNSVLWQLGLRDGDILLSVNKAALKTTEDVALAYARVRRARRLTLTVSRGGRDVTLAYRVKRVRGKKDGKLALGSDGRSTQGAGALGLLEGSGSLGQLLGSMSGLRLQGGAGRLGAGGGSGGSVTRGPGGTTKQAPRPR